MKGNPFAICHNDFRTDFRATANLGCAIVCILSLTPFSLNNFIQGRIAIGLASLGIVIVFTLNGVSIIRGQFHPLFVFIGLVPFIISGTFLATFNQGIIGVLWSYPAILAFYIMLTERQAWFANVILLMVILPTQLFVIESAIVVRSTITLFLISTISALFVRVISHQQIRLKEAKDHAESVSRAKSEFFANMSHELRTPLNAILGFTQLMTRESDVSTNQLKNLNTISRSGEHLLSLINNVLEFSKIEAGRNILNEEDFDIHLLLLSINEMFKLRTQQKGLLLTFEQDTDIPQYVHADQNKLRQILINLLSNAVKFCNTGGIKVLLKMKKSKTSHQDNKLLLHFEVIDTGIGIYPLDQEKVFDAFFQSDDINSIQHGTGLGLPISRKLAILMGGSLTMNSEVGVGSTFSLNIPVVPAFNKTKNSLLFTKRVKALEKDQPKFRLLVVEDNENNRTLIVSLLKTVGFNVKEAVNGVEAVRIWEDWQPHLIWMDMRMPVLDGYDATSIIKSKMEKMKSNISTVIIALTASAFEEDRSKVIASGCDDFIRKPVHESEIFNALEKFLKVKFEYQSDDKDINLPIHGHISNEIKCNMMTLPFEILNKLKEATELSDAAMIDNVIEDVRCENIVLADALFGLAENYAYDEILDLIKN